MYITSDSERHEFSYTPEYLRLEAMTISTFYYSLAASTILGIAYGIDVQEDNDPYVDAAERALVSLGLGIAPGVFLVESIPALKYIPEWFPG